MTLKTHRAVTISAAAVPSLLIAFSAFGKLSGSEAVVEGLTKLGVGPYLPIFGFVELTFAALFLFPKTMKPGFILLSCYFAGTAATELSHGMTPISPTIILVIIWVAAFVRDKSIFMPLVERKHGT